MMFTKGHITGGGTPTIALSTGDSTMQILAQLNIGKNKTWVTIKSYFCMRRSLTKHDLYSTLKSNDAANTEALVASG